MIDRNKCYNDVLTICRTDGSFSGLTVTGIIDRLDWLQTAEPLHHSWQRIRAYFDRLTVVMPDGEVLDLLKSKLNTKTQILPSSIFRPEMKITRSVSVAEANAIVAEAKAEPHETYIKIAERHEGLTSMDISNICRALCYRRKREFTKGRSLHLNSLEAAVSEEQILLERLAKVVERKKDFQTTAYKDKDGKIRITGYSTEAIKNFIKMGKLEEIA